MTDSNISQPGVHYAILDGPPFAHTEHIKRRFLDIPYASTSPAQKLDIYLPDEGGGPFPVIVSIHGGAFMGGDKADIQVMPMRPIPKPTSRQMPRRFSFSMVLWTRSCRFRCPSTWLSISI